MRLLTMLLLSLLASGCGKTAIQHANLDEFYTRNPRSIVVVPILNDSPEISAGSVAITNLSQPLIERGYYVFPVYLTDMLLRDIGLTEAGHIHQLPPERFYDLFGADTVLFVTIKDWSTKYLVLQSSIVIKLTYELKDTKTGNTLWKNEVTKVKSSGGSSNLIAMAIAAAIHAMMTDYLPLVREANFAAFQAPKGLPAGPYHPDYQKDKNNF